MYNFLPDLVTGLRVARDEPAGPVSVASVITAEVNNTTFAHEAVLTILIHTFDEK